jgi:hypothetical protein
LAAAVGFTVLAALWSYAAWRQYRLEQPLIGRWVHVDTRNIMTLSADGTVTVITPAKTSAYLTWSVRDDELEFGGPPGRFHQLVRPLVTLVGGGLGIPPRPIALR